MARLKDIARETGLSVNTVSLALRNSPRIAEATRARIRDAADALDYRPNYAARALVSRRTMTVGLLLSEVTSPILTQVARAVERDLSARGYATLLTASNDDPEEERRALETLRARQVDGLLIYPNNCDRLEPVREIRQGGIPVVLLAGARGRDIDAISVDEHHGARIATEHLIGLGHRRIALIDSAELNGKPEKGEGYRAALDAAGIGFDPARVIDPKGHSLSHGFDAFGRAMAAERPPTAILASNDGLALGGLRWCSLHGVRVPQDVAVCGFDNTEYGRFAAVPLTSVDYPVEDLAAQAVARLVALIEGRPVPPAERVRRLEPRLLCRESTSDGH